MCERRDVVLVAFPSQPDELRQGPEGHDSKNVGHKERLGINIFFTGA